jgi:mono/diheme cytochrome c family protein
MMAFSPRAIGFVPLLLGVLGFSSVLLMARGATAAAPEAVPSQLQLSDPEWIAFGKKKFISTCAYCHGEAGDAGKTEPFRDHKNWDPQEIHDTISEGRQDGANVMPSWKESISDDQIWKIVAYIHSLEGKPHQ